MTEPMADPIGDPKTSLKPYDQLTMVHGKILLNIISTPLTYMLN